MPVWDPVSGVGVPLSVAVMDQVPSVFSVTPVKVYTPLSPETKVWLAGKLAPVSLLVSVTVPV